MADERHLTLVTKKRKLKTKKELTLTCIIHCSNVKGRRISPLTDVSFRKIKDSCDIHMQHGIDSETYDHIINDMPDEYLNNVHGYHRICYQKFTNVSKLLKREATTCSDDLSHHNVKKIRVSAESSVLFPRNECLFCTKHRKKRRGKEVCDIFCK